MRLKRIEKRRVCFVTGTRAEFGLMRSTLRAIRQHPRLELQLVCTGMHLDPAHGRTIDTIRADGWDVDAEIPWGNDHSPLGSSNGSPVRNAQSTGAVMAALAASFAQLRSDVVMVVGDRVEAFASAAAAHIAHVPVAHVHGGDRALGQVDDSLRHAITKLAHVHFPATKQSAGRLKQLGEDTWRIRRVGSPGVDGIRSSAARRAEVKRAFSGLRVRRFALLVLHPTTANPRDEFRRAQTVLGATRRGGFDHTVVIYPNNDPGSEGIIRCWEAAEADDANRDVTFRRDVPRPLFLGLLRDAAVLVGNSSSGIIEAASFGTPVVDIGPRQAGRERGENVTNVPFRRAAIIGALQAARDARAAARSHKPANPYGGDGAGRRIADALARVRLDNRLRRKLIAY
jgi:UDP-N-acetylglucosamine 2-epimerase (non-hydrolysing)/GDP/UDP-N,N'-diacetylbacillosamine 2-epimerase (hydrolysing)